MHKSVARFRSMGFATLNENPRSASLFEIFKKFLEKKFTDEELKMRGKKKEGGFECGVKTMRLELDDWW